MNPAPATPASETPVGERGYLKVSTADRSPERSTCGFRQRLILKDDGAPASMTRLKTHDARPHWHAHTHEYYYILAGNGTLTIGAQTIQVGPGDCIWIKPGYMHHATGELESIIVSIPAFDPADMHFDVPPNT